MARAGQGGDGLRQPKSLIRDNRSIAMTNITSLLDQGGTDHPALIVPDGPTLTYRHLRELTEQVAAIAEARSQARTRPDRGIHQMLTLGPPNASPNWRCVLLTREYKSISAGSGTAPALAAGRITYFT